MKSKEISTAYKYLITGVSAFVVFIFAMAMRHTSLYEIYVTMQLFAELPFFAIAITLPFIVFGAIRLVTFMPKEARYFYTTLILIFLLGILYEIFMKPSGLRIFDIIAISVGLFLDMVLYEVYNKRLYGKILNDDVHDYSSIQKNI